MTTLILKSENAHVTFLFFLFLLPWDRVGTHLVLIGYHGKNIELNASVVGITRIGSALAPPASCRPLFW
jgi:hypothetical protein